MARVTPTGRPVHRRLGLLLISVALLLAVAGCGDDDSVFTTDPDGSPATSSSLPGGLGGDDNQGNGSANAGSGNNPGDSAAAIPGSADVYAAIDLTAAADFQALADAFSSLDASALTEDLGEAAGGVAGEIPGSGEALEGVEEAQDTMDCLGESLGLDTGGLPAWIGAEAAVGLFDIQFDAATGEMTEPNALVAVAIDDQPGAAAAVPGFVAAVGTCGAATLTESNYQGVTVYTGTPSDGGAPISLALTEGYLWYGEGAGMVEQAIDLGDGASLADDANFDEVLAALPDGRHVTVYVAVSLIQEAMGALTASLGTSGELGLTLPAGLDPTQGLQGMRGLGMSVTVLEEGVRLELVAVGEPNESLPVDEVSAGNMADLLPADAFGFAGIGAFDVPAAWGSLMEVLAQMPTEEGQGIEETLAMFGTMLGVDIEADLINQLTGEVGLGLLPATVGSLATGSGVNLGIIAVMGVRDAGAMAATAEALATGLGSMTGAPAATRPFEGGTLYALSDGTSDIALFGMAGEHMVITTHESHAAALLAGGDKLAGSARYAEAISGLPQGSAPMLYLDIAALIGALNLEAEQAAGMAPLQTVAASASRDGDVSRSVVYLRVDY